MDAHKLQLKIFVTPESAQAIRLDAFIGIFHRWIKDHVLPELVVDVANYAHVPEGPGVVLIGHESDYFMDEGEGRLGLIQSRKRAGPPTADRLNDLARRTFYAAWLLEQDPSLSGGLRFATNELLFRINDRLVAPATDATFRTVQPELESWADRVFAGSVRVSRSGGPGDLLAARVTSPTSPPLSTLLDRVGGPPATRATSG